MKVKTQILDMVNIPIFVHCVCRINAAEFIKDLEFLHLNFYPRERGKGSIKCCRFS